MVVGHSQFKTSWDDKNCCNTDPPAGCAIPVTGSDFGTTCTDFCTNTSNAGRFVDPDENGCCYGIDEPSMTEFIFAGGALVMIILTLLIEECADCCCQKCAQNCVGCLLFVLNAIGIGCVIFLMSIYVWGSLDSDAGCNPGTAEAVLGVNNIFLASTFCLVIGCLLSTIVTFIGCCCDDADAKRGDGGADIGL